MVRDNDRRPRQRLRLVQPGHLLKKARCTLRQLRPGSPRRAWRTAAPSSNGKAKATKLGARGREFHSSRKQKLLRPLPGLCLSAQGVHGGLLLRTSPPPTKAPRRHGPCETRHRSEEHTSE